MTEYEYHVFHGEDGMWHVQCNQYFGDAIMNTEQIGFFHTKKDAVRTAKVYASEAEDPVFFEGNIVNYRASACA